MIPNKIVTGFIGAFLTLGTIYLALLSWNAVKEHDYIGVSPKQAHSISIVGEGKVTGVPDVANIQLGYSVEKPTVAAAQKDNTDKMNAMIDKLKKDFKIDAKDIRQMDKVSDIIGAAGTIGLNQVGNLTFAIDNPEQLKQAAREKALAQAKEKAEALSKVVGVKLGAIISFSESSNDNPQPPIYTLDKSVAGMGGGPAPTVEAGSNEITIIATVEYEIL